MNLQSVKQPTITDIKKTPYYKKLDQYADAFRSGLGHCVMTCNFGQVFFCNDDVAFGWEENELESLIDRHPKGARDHTIDGVLILGIEHAQPCDCWHSKACQTMDFIECNWKAIQEYTDAERERRMVNAADTPRIKPVSQDLPVVVGTRIRFLRELSDPPCGYHPGIVFARKGETGVITRIGGCMEGFWCTNDGNYSVGQSFGICRTDFAILEGGEND